MMRVDLFMVLGHFYGCLLIYYSKPRVPRSTTGIDRPMSR